MKLTLEEKQHLITALQMRVCYIETGDVTLTAQDVENMKEQGVHGVGGVVKALDENQMRAIIKMKDLMRKILEV